MTSDRLVPINGISLSIRTWDGGGERRPVLLLAGLGDTAETWQVVANDLRRDRVVLAVDLRGHGASTWLGPYSIDAMAADIAALLSQRESQVDVIGHSLGGLVAAKAAASGAPMGRLVLEDVGVLHPRVGAPLKRPDGVLRFDWDMVLAVRPEIDDPDPSWPSILARIAIPTLAISGGATSILPVEHVRELTRLVASGTFAQIEAGHHIHATEPGAFLQAVRTYLDAA